MNRNDCTHIAAKNPNEKTKHSSSLLLGECLHNKKTKQQQQEHQTKIPIQNKYWIKNIDDKDDTHST